MHIQLPALLLIGLLSASNRANPLPAALEGIVVDEAGHPLSGVFVEAFAPEHPPYLHIGCDDSITSSPRMNGMSGANGRFLIPHVYAEHLVIEADLPNRVQSGPVEVDTRAGTTSHVEIRMVPGQVVHGTVLDEMDRPIRNSAVSIQLGSGRDLTAIPDAQGNFTLQGVPPGKVKFEVTAFDCLGIDQVLDDPKELVHFKLLQGATVDGTVLDEKGAPVVGIEVRFEPLELPQDIGWHPPRRFPKELEDGKPHYRGIPFANPFFVSTDGKGAFQFKHLVDGDYVVLAQSKGTRAAAARFTIANGRASPLTLRLEEGLPMAGTLLDPSGRPIPNRRMQAFANLLDHYRATEPHVSAYLPLEYEATTDEHGRFRFEHMLPGAYLLNPRDRCIFTATKEFKAGEENLQVRTKANRGCVGRKRR